VIVLAVLALLPARHAVAQQSDPVAIAAEASAAYRQGDFQRAIEAYERAYALRPEATLLFNLGRCHEAIGTADALAIAIEKYRAYLAAASDAADREAVQRRIEALGRQLQLLRSAAEPARAPAAAPVAVAAPDGGREQTAERSGPSALPWVIAGAGAAGLAAGGVLGLMAASRHDDAVEEPEATRADELQGEAEGLVVGANVAFAVGGTVALAGLVWGIADLLSTPRAPARPAARVRPLVGLGTLALELRL
jgi:tetratricopeptide (TPR) repeat protein